MTRIPLLLAAAVTAAVLMLVAAGSASADAITGSGIVDYYSNGAGHFDADFYDPNSSAYVSFYSSANSITDGNADAGVAVAIYSSDTTTATTYGLHGTYPFQHLDGPTLSGTGTVADPYVLSSDYLAGDYDATGTCLGDPCLKITETAAYGYDDPATQAARDLFITYRVTNEGSQAAKYRLIAAADPQLGNDEGGIGTFDSGNPRSVGTLNQKQGASIGYQEVTPWDAYQEGVPYEIWRRVQRPISTGAPSTGLTSAINVSAGTGNYSDKAMAVQWNEISSALAPASHVDYQVFLDFGGYTPLTLTPQNDAYPGKLAGTGTSADVDVLVNGTDGNPMTLGANMVRWRITDGPNAPTDQSFNTAAPGGSTGHADPSWTWTAADPISSSFGFHTDYIEVWIDLNQDGIQEPNEPDRSAYFDWYDRIALDWQYDNVPRTGNADEIAVTLRDASGNLDTSSTFQYSVTGANPQSLQDCSSVSCHGSDYPNITLDGNNPGRDTIDVYQDFDADGNTTDFGEHRQIVVDWQSQVTLTPDSATYFVGSGTHNISAHLTDMNGSAIGSTALKYKLDGGAATATPQTDASGNVTVLALPTTSAGDHTLTVWHDTNNNGSIDGTEGQTVATGKYSVELTPDQRLTTNTDQYGDKTLTTGTGFDLTTTLKTTAGSLDSTSVPLRYFVDGPDQTNGTQSVNNSSAGTGHATIHLNGPGSGSSSDYVSIFADYNGNGEPDSNEPYTSAYITWYPRVYLTSGPEPVNTSGNQYVYIQLQHADGTPYQGTYTWSVTGANPQAGDSTHSTSAYGYGSISYTGTNGGTDTVHVSFSDGGTQSGTLDVQWVKAQALTLVRDVSNASTGYTAHVTATLKDTVTGNPVAAGQIIHYTIYGANQDAKDAVETNASGQAVISWTGVNAGTDYVYAWPDYNGDGVQQQDEQDAEQNTSVTFHTRVEVTPGSDSNWAGNTENVQVAFHDDQYNVLANQQLKYVITGANPVATPVVTTNSQGVANISWTGREPGYDTLVVWRDLNGNDVMDAGEPASPPMSMYWDPRLYVSPGEQDVNVGTTADISASSLVNTSGTAVSGATLRYVVTGVNPASGTFPTPTDSSGNATLHRTSGTGGDDSVLVFQDLNSNGTRDPGEPEGTSIIHWHGAVTFTPAGNTFIQGNSTDVGVSVSPPGPSLHYQIFGANPTGSEATVVANNIHLTGTNHGVDEIYVWADLTGNGHTSDDPASWIDITWTPRLQITGSTSTKVAGGQTSRTVTLVDLTGNPVTGTQLDWTITGANPGSGSGNTNGQGKLTVIWTGTHPGTDTFSVHTHDNAFSNSSSAYWSPPPVKLTLTHNTANTALQTNTHTMTGTVTGTSIPGGSMLRYTITGANPGSGAVAINTSTGVAQFTWTGTNAGTDTISAYADISGASGSDDDFDPNASGTMNWTSLVQASSTTADQAIGQPHTETIHFVDGTGAALANRDVFYTITGANPTNGQLTARPIGTLDPGTISARTDSSGNVNITWTGTNAGTDTLNAWGDLNNNHILDAATDPHVQKVVTWRTATAASTGGGTGSSSSIVPPGSPSDFDGRATPLPPVVAKTVNVEPVSGTVLVRLPGKNKFIPLLDAESIPVGSIVDVTHGRVQLTSAQNLKGGVATADFYLGVFQIAQKKSAKPITDLKLVGGNFKSCPKISKGASLGQAARKRQGQKQVRQLWGEGKGQFRTVGKYASAAIRGTTWDVVDFCNGTLVKVAKGVVTVVDNVRHKRIAVKAPKTYFAAAKKK